MNTPPRSLIGPALVGVSEYKCFKVRTKLFVLLRSRELFANLTYLVVHRRIDACQSVPRTVQVVGHQIELRQVCLDLVDLNFIDFIRTTW